MGYKRHSYDIEELPCKHFRQLDKVGELSPVDGLGTRVINLVQQEDCCFDAQWCDVVDQRRSTECANADIEDPEINAQFSSCSEDDTGSGATSLSSLSTDDSVEFDGAHITFSPSGENNIFLDHSPKKQVPIGPNYQASLPTWIGNVDKVSRSVFTSSSYFGTEITPGKDDKFLGKTVILMPDSNLCSDIDQVGGGRSDCNCADCGSIRCVSQHVMEAREKLRMQLEWESFVNLGFNNMGDSVACIWSEEEEDTFHDVVYSYPASWGRNFWKHLSAMFPSRTKKELVSYYFNVFMLHRRATQNRVESSNVDSDDDEFHDSDVFSYHLQVSEEEGDSAVVSLDDEDALVKSPEDFSEDLVHGEGDCMDDIDHDCDKLDLSAGCRVSLVGEEGNTDEIQQGNDYVSLQDDSCTSFDSQNGAVDHCNLLNPASSEGVGFRIDSVLANHDYFLDPCDSKDWYSRYLTCLTTGVDFLPTSNIIEEIFGQGSPEKKA